jgi:uncharacterized repeat protein (TIGR03803 family)
MKNLTFSKKLAPALLLALALPLTMPIARGAAQYNALLDLFSVDNGNDRDNAPLLLGRDGVIYGITDGGTNGGAGTVFRINRDGTGYRLLHSFNSTDSGGAAPKIGLAEGGDGALYGTTSWGGAYATPSPYGSGTLYKINKDGSGFLVLHNFSGEPNDGDGFIDPYGENALLVGSDGRIYGTTYGGGAYSRGTAFRLNLDGSGYEVLYHFSQPVGDGFHDYGRSPGGGLIEGGDGRLYGIASDGGLGDAKDGDGVVFAINKDGSGYIILHNFSSDTGDLMFPQATLLEGSDGAVYGTASEGGPADTGGVFTLQKDGSGYAILHTFTSTADVGDSHRLVEGLDGFLYGTTEADGPLVNYANYGTIYRLQKDGSGYTVLHDFGTDDVPGAYPGAGMVKDTAGVFYGMTYDGGVGAFGVLYKLWPPETPEMLGVTRTGSAMQVSFAGTSGYRYQLLRSTNLTSWSPLTTITMPPSGIYTYLDITGPADKAFYRVAWVP